MVNSKFPLPSLNRERYRVLWYGVKSPDKAVNIFICTPWWICKRCQCRRLELPTSLPLVDRCIDLYPLAQPLVRALPQQQQTDQHRHEKQQRLPLHLSSVRSFTLYYIIVCGRKRSKSWEDEFFNRALDDFLKRLIDLVLSNECQLEGFLSWWVKIVKGVWWQLRMTTYIVWIWSLRRPVRLKRPTGPNRLFRWTWSVLVHKWTVYTGCFIHLGESRRY